MPVQIYPFFLKRVPQPQAEPQMNLPRNFSPPCRYRVPSPSNLLFLKYPQQLTHFSSGEELARFLARFITAKFLIFPCPESSSFSHYPLQIQIALNLRIPQPCLRFCLNQPSQMRPLEYDRCPLPCLLPYFLSPQYFSYSRLVPMLNLLLQVSLYIQWKFLWESDERQFSDFPMVFGSFQRLDLRLSYRLLFFFPVYLALFFLEILAEERHLLNVFLNQSKNIFVLDCLSSSLEH